MVLRPDEFTDQGQEVLWLSDKIVRRYKHSQWDAEHLLLALLELKNGVPSEILRHMDVSLEAITTRVIETLEDAPKTAHEATQL